MGAMKGVCTLEHVVAREWRTTRFGVVVDIIVMPDNGSACRRAGSSHTLRAMKGGSRMIDADSPIGSSQRQRNRGKGNSLLRGTHFLVLAKSLLACPSFFPGSFAGHCSSWLERSEKVAKMVNKTNTRAIRSVQGMLETIRSSLEDGEVNIVHPLWPYFAEHAGVLLLGFDVGQYGQTAEELLKGKSAKVQGLIFAERILCERRRAGGRSESPLACGRTACTGASRRPRETSSWETKVWLLAHDNGQ